MQSHKLGKTGLDASIIGLGTEHLYGQPREAVVSVIGEAIDRGINYFDIVFSLPQFLDNMAAALRGHRDHVLLTGHLGSTEKNGQYFKSRSPKQCETFFLDLLARLGTDHVDVLFLHNFNVIKEWDNITRPGGYLDLACRLRDEGRARSIGISAHYVEIVNKAVASGLVDVVMFPINFFGHAMPGRRELQDLCVRHEVGLVAMKPFGGGRLLTQKGTFRVPKYQTAGDSFKTKITSEITPVQCLSYVLAQAGVSIALAGIKDNAQLAAALHLLDATEAERDFSHLVTSFGQYVAGECVYCNHCLPCPAVIDIAQVNRLLDAAQWGMSESLRLAYHLLPAKASACTDCGACVERCPFGVEVTSRMKEAVDLFEG